MFWDSHAHKIGNQAGGFIIALENGDQDVITNTELRQMKLGSSFIPVEYVTNKFQKTLTAVVKYHPRIEKYSKDEVIEDIKLRKPNGVILDTLNEPYWSIYDYWEIARTYPEIPFLFSHAGGYKVLDFVEICEFNKNVWLDFSYTQNYFGLMGEKKQLKTITETIKYAFKSSIKNKVLFGSDYPYVNQEECIDYYIKNVDKEIYMYNYEGFISKIGDSNNWINL